VQLTNQQISKVSEEDINLYTRPLDDLAVSVALMYGQARAGFMMACLKHNTANLMLHTMCVDHFLKLVLLLCW
jgi:hypothetical protein